MTELAAIAGALVGPGRGILAADESTPTLTRRFKRLGIESTPETRRAYRELLITTPRLATWISGVILYDETFRQRTTSGRTFPEELDALGLVPGIKVDTGAKPLAGRPEETVTEGLDGLRERVAEYRAVGARFAKWRAVIRIGDGLPSGACLHANAHALARYAALCQEGGLVPIVEPEVLLDGDHTLDRGAEVTDEVLRTTFPALADQGVDPAGIVLKASMVVAGGARTPRPTAAEVAAATREVLDRTVPPDVPGVAFLSGGQEPVEATEHLQAINGVGRARWRLTFSYGRALQDPAMRAWRGVAARADAAQEALAHRARCNGAASTGDYTSGLETAAAA
ncbi:MAG: class I fructose-bisphosphate aldolase [Acidimicrobiales bacterium]